MRELHALGDELRARDAELRTLAERLDGAGSDLKEERERRVIAMHDVRISAQQI